MAMTGSAYGDAAAMGAAGAATGGIVPAAIMGGTALIGGLAGQKAESERQKRKLKMEALQKQAEIEKALGEQKSSAFAKLMNQFTSTLVR